MYDVFSPDGLCGVQLALLYWRLTPRTQLGSHLLLLEPQTSTFSAGCLYPTESVLCSVREVAPYLGRTSWHHGPSLNNRTPLCNLDDHL